MKKLFRRKAVPILFSVVLALAMVISLMPTFSVNVMAATCPDCIGGYVKCLTCSGTGRVTCSVCQGSGRYDEGHGEDTCFYCDGAKTKECNICSGTGKSRTLCTTCGGTGEINDHTHNLQPVNGQAATCTADGWKNYYECAGEGSCGKFFSNNNATPTEIGDSSALETWKTGDGKIAKGHTWGYSASGATLTASCSKSATCGQAPVTLTLTASSANYSGSPVTKSQLFSGINFSAFNTTTGLNLSVDNITINKKGESSSISEITANGWYVAELTVDTNKTARLEFPVGDTVTVTFDANGHGTAPDKIKALSGEKIVKPSDPTASGYTFGGWYKEEECTTAWDFTKDTVTANTTLYAKWEENKQAPQPQANAGASVINTADLAGDIKKIENKYVASSQLQVKTFLSASDFNKNKVEDTVTANVNATTDTTSTTTSNLTQAEKKAEEQQRFENFYTKMFNAKFSSTKEMTFLQKLLSAIYYTIDKIIN